MILSKYTAQNKPYIKLPKTYQTFQFRYGFEAIIRKSIANYGF